jgi:acetylornithine deacetylase/succinyl-diaminopimelate desuccinylase-like protein
MPADMNKIKQHINEYLLNRLPEMAAFCSRLVQTPSVNGLHDERNMAKAIAAQARSLGLHTQIVGHNLQRPNIIVTTAAAGPTGLLLVGHLDTVPEGDPSQWRFPPFSGQAAGGKIFGRGAIDTKGGITAALYALAALSHVKDALPYGRVQFIGVPDEESGATGTLGVKYLDEAGLLEGSGAIYVYPGVDEIPLGHRGLIRFRLIAHGQSAHTGLVGKQGSKQRGQNAVTAMAGLLLLLEQIEPPISKIAYFDQFRAAITPGTAINGGTAINIIPDRCEALIDIRTIPEFDLPEAEAALAQAMAAVAGQRSGPGCLWAGQ